MRYVTVGSTDPFFIASLPVRYLTRSFIAESASFCWSFVFTSIQWMLHGSDTCNTTSQGGPQECQQ